MITLRGVGWRSAPKLELRELFGSKMRQTNDWDGSTCLLYWNCDQIVFHHFRHLSKSSVWGKMVNGERGCALQVKHWLACRQAYQVGKITVKETSLTRVLQLLAADEVQSWDVCQDGVWNSWKKNWCWLTGDMLLYPRWYCLVVWREDLHKSIPIK